MAESETGEARDGGTGAGRRRPFPCPGAEKLRHEPRPGVRLTLVARDVETPYSGMLPGFIAGHYDHDACHIDVMKLAGFAGARLIHAEAVGIDRAARTVLLRDRPPIRYDLLSLDIGSTPRAHDVPGAAEHATPVKPVDRLAGPLGGAGGAGFGGGQAARSGGGRRRGGGRRTGAIDRSPFQRGEVSAARGAGDARRDAVRAHRSGARRFPARRAGARRHRP